MRFPDALTPLRDRQFAWFYASRVVSMAGTMMTSVALAFAVLEITDSASALGIVLASQAVPMVIFLLVGGVVADRFPRSSVIKVSCLLSALTQGLVATLVITDVAQLWMLVILEAANGTVAAFSMPAGASLLPQLAPRSHLRQANALISFSRGGLAIIGPSTAALLVVTVGPGWALAFDSLTWLLAALFIMRVRVPARPAGDAPASILRELREGWTVFSSHTWLWLIVGAFGLLNMIHAGAWFTLGPALAKQTIGAGGWGLVLSAESVGLLLMTVVLMKVDIRRPLRSGMLGCALFSLPLLMLGLDPHVVPLMVAAFLAGLGMEVFGIGWNLAVQENIDDDMLSRVYSYDMLGSFVAIPIGQVLFGPLGELVGYREVLVTAAVVYFGICLLTLTFPSVRGMRRASVSDPAPQPSATG